MARAVTKCVFAALLALLSTQAVTPSMRVAAAIEVVRCSHTVQEAPRKARRIRTEAPLCSNVPLLQSPFSRKQHQRRRRGPRVFRKLTAFSGARRSGSRESTAGDCPAAAGAVRANRRTTEGRCEGFTPGR